MTITTAPPRRFRTGRLSAVAVAVAAAICATTADGAARAVLRNDRYEITSAGGAAGEFELRRDGGAPVRFAMRFVVGRTAHDPKPAARPMDEEGNPVRSTACRAAHLGFDGSGLVEW